MLRKRFALHAIWTSLVLVALTLAGQAMAQNVVLSPRSIVVNPVPAFDLEVWVDKDPSGRGAPAYAVGEAIRVSVRPSEDAYVYLFSIAADGEVVQILPNRFDDNGSDAFVRGGTTRTFPPSGARYTFNVAPPGGLAKVIAVASRRPLDVSTLATFRSERDFATSNIGEEGFARALRIIVNPLPQTEWVSATALYYVGSRPAQGAYGTLQVDSEPRRGEVYVDRAFVGYTPLSYGLRPGTYDVEVVGAGASASERVQIRPDRTTEVFLSLRPSSGPGTATFTSSPSGAEVYVDGRFVGTTPTARVTFDVGSYQAEFRRRGTSSSGRLRGPGRPRHARERQPARHDGTLEITANVGGARCSSTARGRHDPQRLRPPHRPRPERRRPRGRAGRPGYRTLVQDVRIRAGETTTSRCARSALSPPRCPTPSARRNERGPSVTDGGPRSARYDGGP
jgi:hypothetical protein